MPRYFILLPLYLIASQIFSLIVAIQRLWNIELFCSNISFKVTGFHEVCRNTMYIIVFCYIREFQSLSNTSFIATDIYCTVCKHDDKCTSCVNPGTLAKWIVVRTPTCIVWLTYYMQNFCMMYLKYMRSSCSAKCVLQYTLYILY